MSHVLHDVLDADPCCHTLKVSRTCAAGRVHLRHWLRMQQYSSDASSWHKQAGFLVPGQHPALLHLHPPHPAIR